MILRLDDRVAQALVVAVPVIVAHELFHRTTKMSLAQWNHLAKTLLFDRSHKAFGVRVQIWTTSRKLHWVHPGRLEDRRELLCERRPAIMDQILRIPQEPLKRISQVPSDLGHPLAIGFWDDPGDGHAIDMTFTSLSGSGNVTVQQTNASHSNSPCANVCSYRWDMSKDAGITSFSTDLSFHYTDADATGYTESTAYFGIAKYNSSTNTWQWLGGTVDADNNKITVNGVTSFSTFTLFRRIFGDCTDDGYVDAADFQHLGDCWHQTSSGEFTESTDARFFNYNKNTDSGNQIIDAADFQVFDHEMVIKILQAFVPKEYKFETYRYTSNGWIKSDPKDCGNLTYCYPFQIPAPDNAAAARGVALLKLVK